MKLKCSQLSLSKMFKFLKDKLRSTISKFTDKFKEEGEPVDERTEEAKEEQEVESEVKEEGGPVVESDAQEAKKEDQVEVKEKPEPDDEKKGIFEKFKQKVGSKKINEAQFENFFEDLELVLMEGNVAVEVIDKIKRDMKIDLVDVPIKRRKISETVRNTLRDSIEDLFKDNSIDLFARIREKKPYIISFFGINGSGKTTTIAKLARILLDKKLSVVLAAGDTFRAASIEQLQHHADTLKVKLIKHEYGSDPAAVAFDAIKHGEAKKVDVVLIDTAGRQHSNKNLMEEMKKIVRVAKPDLKIFVGESITGNDCVEQAKSFNEAIGIDGIILTKADIDDKGGAAVSISYVTGKPIMYLGTGQEYEDLHEFNSKKILDSIGL